MGSWGFYSWPSEPSHLSDAEWWRQEERYACEEDAVPTYDELMAWEDSGIDGCEIGEWQG